MCMCEFVFGWLIAFERQILQRVRMEASRPHPSASVGLFHLGYVLSGHGPKWTYVVHWPVWAVCADGRAGGFVRRVT